MRVIEAETFSGCPRAPSVERVEDIALALETIAQSWR
jgi:hypothetical protein